MRLKHLAIVTSLTVLVLGTAACGFQPLYGDTSGGEHGQYTRQQLSNIAVSVSPRKTQEGHALWNDLRRKLKADKGKTANKLFLLTVKHTVEREAQSVSKTDQVARYNLNVRVDFILSNRVTKKIMLRGNQRTVAAYNVQSSDYATLIAEKDAHKRALVEAGDDLVTRLAIFFERGEGRSELRR